MTHPGLQVAHPVAAQQRFQRVELAFLNGALRQQDDIDGPDLVPGGKEHPVDEIQVERFLGCELEEAERLLREPLDRVLHGPKVRLSDLQRPRQQQQLGVLGLGVRTAMASGQLVPAGLETRTINARVA